MTNQITVLIPTSPIPCHPSTAILDETIANVRKYTDAEIVIMFDGVHEKMKHREDDYKEYIRRTFEGIDSGAYGPARGIVFSEHEHQARMTRRALESVNTPLILFCEHDTSPIGEIPFQEICDLLQWHSILNYIRFNIFHTILEEHEYLMLGTRAIASGDTVIQLRDTIQWSQRPHIAKADWYRNILNLCFKGQDKTMIEDVMHGVVIEKYKELGKDTFGLAIYTPEGNQLRSYHSDARGSDEKITYG